MKKNREGYLVSDTQRECTECGTIFKKISRTVTLCPACNVARVKKQSPEQKMLQRAKSRAKIRGVEFALELKDITIPKSCPILGIELVCGSGNPGGNFNSPALDRIDNTKGYIPGNVWVISCRANMMKSDASFSELKSFAAWINSL